MKQARERFNLRTTSSASATTALLFAACAILAGTSGCVFFQDGSSNTSTGPEDMSTALDMETTIDMGKDLAPSVDMPPPIDEGRVEEDMPIETDMGEVLCVTHEECGMDRFCNAEQQCEECGSIKEETICRAGSDEMFRCKVDSIPPAIVNHCELPFASRACICPSTMSATCVNNMCQTSCVDDEELAAICMPYLTNQNASYQKICGDVYEAPRCSGAPEPSVDEFVHVNTRVEPANPIASLGRKLARTKDRVVTSTGHATMPIPQRQRFQFYIRDSFKWSPASLPAAFINSLSDKIDTAGTAQIIALGEHAAFIDDQTLALSIRYVIGSEQFYNVTLLDIKDNAPRILQATALPENGLEQEITDMDASSGYLALGLGASTTSSVHLYRLMDNRQQFAEQIICATEDEGRFTTRQYRAMGTAVKLMPPIDNNPPAVLFTAIAKHSMEENFSSPVVDICTLGALHEELNSSSVGGTKGRPLYEVSTFTTTLLLTTHANRVHIVNPAQKMWETAIITTNVSAIPTFSPHEASTQIADQDYMNMRAITANSNMIGYTTPAVAVTISDEQQAKETQSTYIAEPALEGGLGALAFDEAGSELLFANPSETGSSIYVARILLNK